MGTAPAIYDRPVITPVLEEVTDRDDYTWAGPFEFEELFYLDREVPSNFIILLPEFAKSPRIQEKMMSDFESNPPKVMYFDKQYSIRGKRVVVTGALPGRTRRGVESWLRRHNGILQNSVNGATDYLITTNKSSTTTKAAAARRREIPIIKPEQVKEWTQR